MNIFEKYRVKNLIKHIRVIVWDLDETMYYNKKTINYVRNCYVSAYSHHPDYQQRFLIQENLGMKWFEIIAQSERISEKKRFLRLK